MKTSVVTTGNMRHSIHLTAPPKGLRLSAPHARQWENGERYIITSLVVAQVSLRNYPI